MSDSNRHGDDQPAKPSDTSHPWHPPMPYVVKLRVALSDDARPESVEIKVVAYSAFHAVSQALYETVGSAMPGTQNIVVESVNADAIAYYRLQAELVAAAILGRKV